MKTLLLTVLAKATFAGGCFWCMEPPFEKLKGVVSVTSGYTGGETRNPTYDSVSAGGTGHREAVQILYDPQQISYAQLLDIFWHNVDPSNGAGQFCDFGEQYTTAIYYHDQEQRRWAQATLKRIEEVKKIRVVTDILPAAAFYPAEEYHQDYYRKNPVRYRFYRFNCGRDQTLKRVWGRAPK
jgi:peptide-methionine (S)-S-oxide reductase